MKPKLITVCRLSARQIYPYGRHTLQRVERAWPGSCGPKPGFGPQPCGAIRGPDGATASHKDSTNIGSLTVLFSIRVLRRSTLLIS